MAGALALLKAMLGSLRDLMPIVLVIAFFQLFVLQEPLPHLLSVLSGLVLVVLGLTFSSLAWKWGCFRSESPWLRLLLAKGAYSGC